MQFKKILLPVDGSEHSMKAAGYARELARMTGAQVVILTVYGKVSSLLMGEGRAQVVGELKDQAAKVVDKYSDLFTDVEVAFLSKVVEGEPGGAISEVAAAEGCDLIVMGSRGLTDTEGLVLGSVAHKVLHLVKVPVLVVR